MNERTEKVIDKILFLIPPGKPLHTICKKLADDIEANTGIKPNPTSLYRNLTKQRKPNRYTVEQFERILKEQVVEKILEDGIDVFCNENEIAEYRQKITDFVNDYHEQIKSGIISNGKFSEAAAIRELAERLTDVNGESESVSYINLISTWRGYQNRRVTKEFYNRVMGGFEKMEKQEVV